MAEQDTSPEAADQGEPEAAADDAIDVSEVADVDEAGSEQPDADAGAEEPQADAPADEGADEPEADASADADAGGDDEGGDDNLPTRDPDDQAGVDAVTEHATKVGGTSADGPIESPFRTPPGIPGGLDPGTSEERG
jgi:hypothetical protein